MAQGMRNGWDCDQEERYVCVEVCSRRAVEVRLRHRPLVPASRALLSWHGSSRNPPLSTPSTPRRRRQFTEITQVSYPPAYEHFLEVIGIFTFDLGWIFSAACLTTELDFYDKLL